MVIRYVVFLEAPLSRLWLMDLFGEEEHAV